MNDPLEIVFETPEESLAWFLKSMPSSLIPVFQREFMRRPTPAPADSLPPLCPVCGLRGSRVKYCSNNKSR